MSGHLKKSFQDALKEAGEKADIKERMKDGYYLTNIYWKNYHDTIKNWEG